MSSTQTNMIREGWTTDLVWSISHYAIGRLLYSDKNGAEPSLYQVHQSTVKSLLPRPFSLGSWGFLARK